MPLALQLPPSYPSSRELTKEIQKVKPELKLWRLIDRANGAELRREFTTRAMATSNRIFALSVMQRSTSLKPSRSKKVKERPRTPNELQMESHRSSDGKEIHFSEGEKRLLEALAFHDGKGRANPSPKVLFKSIGSRSSPSRSSIPGRRSKYSKPDPKLIKQASPIVSNSRGIRELLHSPNSEDEMTEIGDEEELDFGWYDSDLENDEEGKCLIRPDLKVMSSDAKQRENKDVTTSQEEDMNDSNQHYVMSKNETKKPKVNCSLTNKQRRKSLEKSNELAETKHETKKPKVNCSLTNKQRRTSSEKSTELAEAKHELESAYSNNYDTGEHTSVPGKIEQDACSWKSHPLCDLPFEIQYSYSETPTNTPILGLREDLSPFGPTTMQRPWTGLPPVRRRRHLENAVNPVLRKFILNCYPEGPAMKLGKSREEILGMPLSKEEITYLVNKCHQENRQVNLGRDGLTHNMLHLVHTHWKTRPVCKIKCRGVPTVDMDNVSFHVEDKTGGKIIYRSGGVLYVFRGRNYNHKTRPRIPLMLWKPASPIYPMLVPKAPLGLTGDEAYQLRVLGQKVEPLCKLDKNGVYLNLVDDIRDAFQIDELVVLEYDGLKSTDYKKLAAKLRDLVPCIILSFRNRRILLWKGRGTGASVVGAEVHLDDHESFKDVNQEPLTLGRENENETLITDESIGTSFGKECLDCIVRLYSDIPASNLLSSPGENNDEELYSGSAVDKGLSHAEECTILHPVMDRNHTNDSEASIDDNKVFCIKDLHVEECTSTMDWKNMNELYDEPLSDIEECTSTIPAEDRNNVNGSDNEASSNNSLDALLDRKNVNESYDGSLIKDNLDDSWDLALRCEMALKLEDVSNLDADLILQKAHIFCKVAPIGPDYSELLINRLRIEVDHEKKEQHFEVHFYTKCMKAKNH